MLKKWTRTSLSALQTEDYNDPHGHLMISHAGQVDTSALKILSSTVDTIRQLYIGTLKKDVLDRLDECYKNRTEFVTAKGVCFVVGGAMVGGYRYKLQNNTLGLIVLVKHRYHDADAKAPHLKIDLSPRLIQSKDPLETQEYLDSIADFWLESPEPTGCAVHMAVDVQGWEPPENFTDRFVTRSKRMAVNTGISEFSIETGEIATSYNRNQSMLFGTARGLQCAIYNKTEEAIHRGKLSFWESLWQRLGGDEPFTSAYNPDLPVWRIEIRFHQSILKEFAHGTLDQSGRYKYLNTATGEEIGTDWQLLRFIDVVPHLSGLWRKATTSFRLDLERGKLIDPFWQRINEDALFFETEETLDYRRVKRPASEGIERNLQIALGNLISIYSKETFSYRQVINFLKHGRVWEPLVHHYQARGMSEMDLTKLIQHSLFKKRLLGKAV